MSLSGDYLKYPHRSEGMDHTLYPYVPLGERPKVRRPDGAPLAFWITVSLEVFPLTPNDGPRAPGHMVTPWPDLRTYTVRDYGNRVGVFRILDILKARDLKASIPVSTDLLERAPALIDRVLADGHELVALGANMNAVHTGDLSADLEAERLETARDILKARTGAAPAGWMSPGRFQTDNTISAAAAAGYAYHCDWVNDDMPYTMAAGGGTVTAMPYTHELEDRHCLTTLGQPLETWCGSITDAASLFRNEARASGSGRLLHLGLTPYIIGQPFRVAALGPLLDAVIAGGPTWTATGREIEKVWRSSNENEGT